MSATKTKRLAATKILVLVVYGALQTVSWAGGNAAAPLVRTDWPIMAAPLVLPVTRAGGGDNGSSAVPQFTFGASVTVYETHYEELRAVDFANLNYLARGIAPDLSIPLRNGTYDARDGGGFERAELLDMKICDGAAPAAPLAVVRLRYASGAGSSTCDEIVQIFRVRDGRLAALHEIVYACAPGGTYAVDCNTGTVTATASAWLGSDPHCCPSARDTAIFSFIGNHLQLLSWRREAWVSGAEPEQ